MPTVPHTDVVSTIPEPDVRAELDRILASKGFATAGRLSKLLRYVVEKTLAGETDQLKEYAVGIEVFERDEKYDPRLDSIVRVEAGRLRSRLDEYYNIEGSSSPIRIALPRGGYSAVFTRVDSPTSGTATATVEAVRQPRRSRAAIPLAAGLLCAIGAMVVWLGGWNHQAQGDRHPAIAVLAFKANMAGDDNERLASRLTEAVTTELARLGTLSVASHTSAMQFAGQQRSIRDISATLNVDYVVEASVDDDADRLLLVARMVDASTDRKTWVSDYRGGRDDVRGIAQRVAFDVSEEILRRKSARP
jgi:TolB-like protein